jgi:PTS system fructose-specific IIA component/PTS system nitrogen regulatory IIA component
LLWFDDTATLDSLEFIPRGAVIWRLEVANKTEAIAALVDRLLATGNLRQEDAASVLAALTHREELGSTAIGGGVAIPHTKHPSISHVVGAVGYAPSGVDFNSPDGQPVHTVVMLLSPPERPGEYLRALEKVAQRIRHS